MQIQISWLLKKQTDLDLHCLVGRAYPGSAEVALKLTFCLPFNENGYTSALIYNMSPHKEKETVGWLSWSLTHCSQETRKRVTDKQCRPRSDAAECGI